MSVGEGYAGRVSAFPSTRSWSDWEWYERGMALNYLSKQAFPETIPEALRVGTTLAVNPNSGTDLNQISGNGDSGNSTGRDVTHGVAAPHSSPQKKILRLTKSEVIQILTDKKVKSGPHFKPVPWEKAKKIRDLAWLAPINQSVSAQLTRQGYFTVCGIKTKFTKPVNTLWPPTKNHPTHGWRARYVARAYLNKCWGKHWLRTWMLRELVAVEAGKRPFKAWLLMKVEDAMAISRAIRYRIYLSRPGRRKMTISFGQGNKLGWQTPFR